MKVKKNREFKQFLELKAKYEANPTKAQKEEVQNEASKLIASGWATPSLRVVFDFGIEKYRTMGLNSLETVVYDKDKSVRIILKHTYGGFLPKGAIDMIQGKKLIFHPHKPISYSDDGIEYANLFMKSKFLSFDPRGKRINSIDWSKYPVIAPLFENVFKTTDRMNYFINWLAYGMQTLKKAQTSIISKGTQGTGKGVIYEQIIQYMIGEKYTTLLENEALKSRFNGELENKLFVLANEIKADFREGNTSYERLKMYITDSQIRFEEKNTKARTIPNFFNMWFHSNNDVPLQIQGSDRRYTVFNTKSRKLIEVSEALGFEHISDYIEAINKERDSFIYDIMSIKYNKYQATTPLETEEKELIYEASMSKIEVLSDKLKKLDIAYFQDTIEDFYQGGEMQNVSMDLNKLNISNPIEFVRELQKQMNGNHIKNGIAKVLYKIFVNENESDRKIWLQFNKHFGKAEHKWIDVKTIKYRRIDSDKEVIFTENIPLEIEEPNGTIKNMLINKENGELTPQQIAKEAEKLF